MSKRITSALVAIFITIPMVGNKPSKKENICLKCHKVTVFESIDEAKAVARELMKMGFKVKWEVKSE